MRKLLAFLGLLTAFLGLLTEVLAFESVEPLPPCEWGGISDQIFVGTFTGRGADSGPCHLRIDEVLKGIKPGTEEIEVAPGPCGAGYKTGLRYLVFVYSEDGRRTVAAFGEPAERFAASIDFFAHWRAANA